MGITASSYTLFPDTISCGGEVEGILSLSAGPDIVSNPADIVMVLDCSGSMEGDESQCQNIHRHHRRIH